MNTRKVFSLKLQKAIKYSPITYAELSRQLDITKATMSMYKNSKALPSLETFNKICEILDVSANFLLGKNDL